MKKIFGVLAILLTFTLAACGEQTTPMDEFLEDLDLDDTINDSITFPETYESFDVTVESSDTDILDTDGTVYQSNIPDDGTVIDLTFYLEDDEESYEETIRIEVVQSGRAFIQSSRTLAFENLASEYLLDEVDYDLHYSQHGGMPFVEIEDFLTLLDGGESQGAINFELFEISKDGAVMTLEIVDLEDEDEEDEEFDEDDVIIDDDVERILEIDFDENTLTVTSFDYFRAFAESTQTDFGEDLELYDYEFEEGDTVTMDLSEYDFELIYQNGGYYMPFHLANLFFSGTMYDVYYNGDMIYGFDTYQATDSGFGSDLRSSDYYDEIDDLYLEQNYNYMAFSFDYFYGLKDDQGVTTYYNEFDGDAFMDANNHTDAVFEAVYDLDDLHTSFLMPGFFDSGYNRDAGFDDFGDRTAVFNNNYQYLFDENLCPGGVNFRYLDDEQTAAAISISGFNADTPGSFSNAIDILDASGTVEDIVIDLACNTGGVVGSMIQILGYMTDEPLPFNNLNPTDSATSTTWYTSEVEARDDFNWHILSSPVSYSAANMMISIANDLDIATIIGEDSAGGAASITTNILPSGTMIIMSSTSVSANNDYESIEMGVEVDHHIPLEDFNDHSAILRAIR